MSPSVAPQTNINLQTALNFSSQLLVLVDEECRIQVANLAAREKLNAALGVDIQPGDAFFEFVPAEYLDEFKVRVKAALNGQTWPFDVKFISADGLERWFEWHFNAVSIEEMPEIQLCLEGVDITQRNRAEADLRRRESRLKNVLSSISDHIYMTEITKDGEQVNRYLSPTETLTGYPLSKLLEDWNFWPSTIIHPDDRVLAASQAARLAAGENSETEYRLIRADGNVIWVRDNGRVEQNPDTGSLLVFGVVSDITNRKSLEDQLTAIYHLGQELTFLRNETDIIRRVLKTATTAITFNEATIGLIDSTTDELVFSQEVVGGTIQAINSRVSLNNRQDSNVLAVQRGEIIVADEANIVEMCIPLKFRQHAIGVLCVRRDTLSPFTPEAKRLLLVLADQAAGALENARLYGQTQRWAEQLSTLYELDRAITVTLNLTEVYKALAHYAAQLLPYSYMSITIMEKRFVRTIEIDSKGEILETSESKYLAANSAINSAISNDQSLLHNQIGETVRFSEDTVLLERDIKSAMVVPLRAKGRVFGAWLLGSPQPQAYGKQNLNIAESVAGQLSAALENAQLYNQIQQRFSELSALNIIGQAVNSTLNLSKTLTLVTDHTLRLLQAGGVSVVLCDDDNDDLWFAANSGDESEFLVNKRFPKGQGIVGWVIKHGKAELVTNVSRDSRFYGNFDQESGFTTQSVLCCPLRVKNKIIGAIEVINKQNGQFGYEDLNLLTLLAAPAATAIENASLFEKERKQYRRLQESQTQLVHVEKMAALGRLAASMAHEINNPLQSIDSCLTLVEELLQNSAYEEKGSLYLGMAMEEIERIASIVHRMREFYRPSPKKDNTDDETDLVEDFYHAVAADLMEINLHTTLETVLQLTNKQCQQTRVTVTRDWADELPLLQANPNHLKQVFLNLILNALEAMPQGGQLDISTTPDEILYAGRGLKPAVRIEFGDTGPGMSEEALLYVFEPLFTTKEQGSGLGLYTSYKIIEAHHGKITVRNKPEKGTVFTILLPVVQPEEF